MKGLKVVVKSKHKDILKCRKDLIMDLNEVSKQSQEIRELYHALEKQIHGTIWTVEEDALAFSTDAGLVGRLTMDNQGRWPSEETKILPSKIGECVWWLAILSERMGFDFADCVEQFLKERLEVLEG